MATGRPPGRPAKPVEKKRAEGNLGKRKLPETPLARGSKYEDAPAPPPHLKNTALTLWGILWEAGKIWLDPQRDYLHAQLLCEAWQEYHFLRRQLELGDIGGGVDRVIATGKNGHLIAHPYVSMKDREWQKLQTASSALGLSPTDFARLQIAEVNLAEQKVMDALLAPRTGIK